MNLSELIQANRASLFALLFLFVTPFLFDSLLLSFIISHQEYFQQLPLKHWILIYLLVMLAMAFGLTHTTFIAILSGYFLEWTCIPYVIISYLMASVIGYLAGRKISGGKLMNGIMQLPKAAPIARELMHREFMIILLSRLSPALPFAVTNLLLAMLKADFKKYFIAGAIGMLPRTLIFIWTGTQAKTIAEALKNPENLSFSRILTIAFLIISVTGLFYYFSKAIKKATSGQ